MRAVAVAIEAGDDVLRGFVFSGCLPFAEVGRMNQIAADNMILLKPIMGITD